MNNPLPEFDGNDIFCNSIWALFKNLSNSYLFFYVFPVFLKSISFPSNMATSMKQPTYWLFWGQTLHEFLESLSFLFEFILQRNKNEEIPNEATGFGIIISRLCIGTNSTIVSQQKWLKKCNLKSWFQIYTPSFPHIVIQQQQTLLPEIVERRHTTTCSLDKWPPKLYV